MFKGIPNSLRTKIWSFALASEDEKEDVNPKGEIEKINSKENTEKAFEYYSSLVQKVSGQERQIDLDIERTLRDHIHFKTRFGQGQSQLFRILVAFSNYCPNVGYCQGMSTITAFLLLYFDEQSAFQHLCSLFEKLELEGLFSVKFPKLFASFHTQEVFMKKKVPKILKHFTKLNIGPSLYAPKWYLILFLQVPYQTSLRIWDLFQVYGYDMLVVCGVSLLKYFEKDLLKMKFEAVVSFLSRLENSEIDSDDYCKIVFEFWKAYEKLGLRVHYTVEDVDDDQVERVEESNVPKNESESKLASDEVPILQLSEVDTPPAAHPNIEDDVSVYISSSEESFSSPTAQNGSQTNSSNSSIRYPKFISLDNV